MTSLKTKTVAAIAILLAGVVYLITEFTVAKAWINPAYDWANNFVPDLGNSAHGLYLKRNVNSPLYTLMDAAFVFEAVLFGGAAILFSRLFEGKTRKTMVVFGVIHIICLSLFGIFHQAPVVSGNYARLLTNVVNGGVGILAGNAIVIVAGSQWKRLSLPSWYGWLSIIINAVSIILVFVLFGNDKVPGGIRERISIYSFVYWQVITGLILLLKNRTTEASLQYGMQI